MSPTACDCGRPRDPRALACVTCTWLDGATESEARVIDALRALGSAGTWDALTLEIDMPERTLWRTLAKLRAVGRIVVRDDGERATYTLRAT